MDGGVPPPMLFSTLSAAKVRITYSWESWSTRVNVIVTGEVRNRFVCDDPYFLLSNEDNERWKSSVASATILVWDIALTFDLEVGVPYLRYYLCLHNTKFLGIKGMAG